MAINRHISIIEKDGAIGVLGFITDGTDALVGNYDSRRADGQIFLKEFAKSKYEALAEYQKAVATTVERGWKLIYKGKPNHG